MDVFHLGKNVPFQIPRKQISFILLMARCLNNILCICRVDWGLLVHYVLWDLHIHWRNLDASHIINQLCKVPLNLKQTGVTAYVFVFPASVVQRIDQG